MTCGGHGAAMPKPSANHDGFHVEGQSFLRRSAPTDARLPSAAANGFSRQPGPCRCHFSKVLRHVSHDFSHAETPQPAASHTWKLPGPVPTNPDSQNKLDDPKQTRITVPGAVATVNTLLLRRFSPATTSCPRKRGPSPSHQKTTPVICNHSTTTRTLRALHRRSFPNTRSCRRTSNGCRRRSERLP